MELEDAAANCSQVSSSARVEGLRVFRIVFDLRSEKLLHRCNLPAQVCVRLLHLISSARIAFLDLVLGIMFPSKRHLDFVSNDCDSALS